MKVKLINVGRGKVCKVVEVKKSSDILFEVRKYLMSSEVEIAFDTAYHGKVLVGGFRVVGEFEILPEA